MAPRRPRRANSGGPSSFDALFPRRTLVQEILEEQTLILASVISVIALYISRSIWFPAAAVESLVPPPTCELPTSLNAQGAVEGPWLNATWQEASPLIKGAMSGPQLLSLGKLVALNESGDDGLLKPQHLTQGLEALGSTPLNATTLAFARLAERYLATWLPIDGVTKGLGKRGMVKDIALKAMATNKKLAPCAAQVRILEGKVYFRYGSFLEDARKLRRTNLMVWTIQQAVTRYNLKTLKAELYLNACDDPQSYDNSLSSGKSGFALFSTQHTPGSTDILCPDPLDLIAVRQMPPLPKDASWHKRLPKAVWRGEGFEFELRAANWASSFRARLHRMTDVRPDLLDARVTMWGSKDRGAAKVALIRNGFVLGIAMSKEAKVSNYKYALVVDEAVGSRDMCAALVGPQAAIRHASGFAQFFEPLLLPGVHYMPVRHSLADLFETVEWMQQNDASMRRMVENANSIAPLICSEEGHMHFWAVLLSKYSARAMEEPEAVKAPKACAGGKAVTSADWAKDSEPATCVRANAGACMDFCTEGKAEDEWTWLDSSVVAGLSFSTDAAS